MTCIIIVAIKNNRKGSYIEIFNLMDTRLMSRVTADIPYMRKIQGRTLLWLS